MLFPLLLLLRHGLAPSRLRTVEARWPVLLAPLIVTTVTWQYSSCVLGVLGVVLLVLLAPYVVLWTGIMPISFWPPYGSQRSFSRAYPPLGAVESNCSVGTLAFVASSASGPLPWVGLPGRVPGLVPPSWCTPSRPPPPGFSTTGFAPPPFLVSPGVRSHSGVYPGPLPGLLLSVPPDCST